MEEKNSKNPQETQEKADVVFLVGENEEKVPAFKQKLVSTNAVFKKMFESDKKGEIKIPEFQPNDFRAFLNYLYNGEINFFFFRFYNSFNIYAIAHKYMEKSLCQLAAIDLVARVRYGNIFKLLEFNATYEDDLIDSQVKVFFCSNAIGCLKTNPGFEGLSKKAVAKLLKWQTIKCPESLLYENLLKWAGNQISDTTTTKMQFLKELLPLIQLNVSQDDGSYNKLAVKNRCNWTCSDIIVERLEKTTRQIWTMKLLFFSDRICFGLKMPLTNLTSESKLFESFGVFCTTSCGDGLIRIIIKDFQMEIEDTFALKDIYFKKPMIFEKLKPYKICISFKEERTRFFVATDEVTDQITEIKNPALLLEKYKPTVHDIFRGKSK